jgi:hypothetical protein
MSTTSVHPVHSTSEPAHAAEGLEPVTPGASATGKHAVGAAQPDGVKKEKPQQQGKGKDKKDKKAAAGGEGKGPLELSPPPEYFQERIKIYDEYKAKYDKWVAGASNLRFDSYVVGAEQSPQSNPVCPSPSRLEMENRSRGRHGRRRHCK